MLRNLLKGSHITKNMRAAKKQTVVKPSPFRINIFKDKKDPVLKPDSEYPIWLFELMYPNLTMSQREGNWMMDEGYEPRENEMKSYRKLLQRYKLKHQNKKAVAKTAVFDDDRDFDDDHIDPNYDGGYGTDKRPYDIHRGQKPMYENLEVDVLEDDEIDYIEE
jgi:hypothetical protein